MINGKGSRVTVFRLPWGTSFFDNREEWFQNRTEGISFKTNLVGEEAAEEAFHITNAPEDCLNDEQKTILKEQNFKGPSLSVGDVVKVAPIVHDKSLSEYYICKSFGWEKFNGDFIKLIKHLIY